MILNSIRRDESDSLTADLAVMRASLIASIPSEVKQFSSKTALSFTGVGAIFFEIASTNADLCSGVTSIFLKTDSGSLYVKIRN